MNNSEKVCCKRGHDLSNALILSTGSRACRDCAEIRRREFRIVHEITFMQKQKNYALTAKLKKCNLPRDAYEEMAERQQGLCAICGGKQVGTGDRRLDIDHNHLTDAPRELLCGSCNRGLGLFRDCPEILRKAAEYLEKHSEVS